jgi:histidinol-phosphate/aromatic aminotransferase/cobyric acid decarboxylase-like protein/GNAT superfamily N-acetyltransferase
MIPHMQELVIGSDMEDITELRLCISVANTADRPAIYRIRHDVYAAELGQYESRPDGILADTPDTNSLYITASIGGELAGFVGVTSPSSPRFSIDKYLSRDEIQCTFDEHLYEIRALTVKSPLRGFRIAACLMYAAFRWVEAHGGKRILSIGRREVLDMYLRLGFKRIGQSFRHGAVTYDLISAETSDIVTQLERFRSRLDRMDTNVDWKLGIVFRRPSECYHGGAFFDAIGDQFDDLSRRNDVISADVLDAWFPPAPATRQVLLQQLPWIMRTSPPTRADGLAQMIAKVRGVEPGCILTGGGSSALIFLAFRHWLNSSSRVLILDPTYGEYSHVLDKIIQCKVDRFLLDRRDGYCLDLESLAKKLLDGFDLFVWVNPNSPTGLHVAKADVEAILRESSACRRVWLDETYVEYAGLEQSLESFAVQSENVIVCKSLSKVYALSGLRVAYLCASPHQLEDLRVLTPPWSVSLPAQIAATYALQSHDYYTMRYQETHELRVDLVNGLHRLGIAEIIPGIANFVMFHLPSGGDDAASIVMRCKAQGLYLRDVSGMGSAMGRHAIRMAVKDAATNQLMLRILGSVLNQPTEAGQC